MLLQEEQHIVQWLSQYGTLPRTQIIKLLKDKSPRVSERMIRTLIKEQRIASVGGGYYLAPDSLSQPDQRTILAVWVLLKFINSVDTMAHYPATYPSQLFFLKENVGYEIVVLYEGEEHLSRLLQPQTDIKYIFVVPHAAMVEKLWLPDAPCLFCSVEFQGGDEPNVVFYTEVAHENQSISV